MVPKKEAGACIFQYLCNLPVLSSIPLAPLVSGSRIKIKFKDKEIRAATEQSNQSNTVWGPTQRAESIATTIAVSFNAPSRQKTGSGGSQRRYLNSHLKQLFWNSGQKTPPTIFLGCLLATSKSDCTYQLLKHRLSLTFYTDDSNTTETADCVYAAISSLGHSHYPEVTK